MLIEIDGVVEGLHLRFGHVMRTRRRGTHAVLQVRWRQYSGTGVLHETIAPRPPRPETPAAR